MQIQGASDGVAHEDVVLGPEHFLITTGVVVVQACFAVGIDGSWAF